MCVSAATAYSQDCNIYFQRASELKSQKKYCEAKRYYQKYSDCNADADVSTEIAMCKQLCPEDEKKETVDKTEGKDKPAEKVKPLDNRKVKSETNKSGFSGFQLHAGVFLPLGDFASDHKNGPPQGKGNAGIGANLGFKVYIPVKPVRGLSWFLGADAFYNGLKSEYTKDFVKEAEEYKLKYRLPFYLNVPVTAGVNYAYLINNKIGIYGEAVCGLNLSNYIGAKASDNDVSYVEKWKMAMGFTYGFEAGTLLFNKMTIGVRYQSLGSSQYKGKRVYDYDGKFENEDIKFNKKLPVSGISINLGILF